MRSLVTGMRYVLRTGCQRKAIDPESALREKRSAVDPQIGIGVAIDRMTGQQSGHQRRPAGLMAGADAAAVVAVKVFMEQHEIAPMRIAGEPRIVRVARTATVGVRQKQRRQPAGDFRSSQSCLKSMSK